MYQNRFELVYNQNHIVNIFASFATTHFWSIKRQFKEDKKIYELIWIKPIQKKEENKPSSEDNNNKIIKTKHETKKIEEKENIYKKSTETLRNPAYKENLKLSKLPAKERMKIIENFLDSPEMIPYYNYVLKQIEWTTIHINWEAITYTKEYIKAHHKNLIESIKTAILFFIYIESVWDPLAQNLEWSSAKWMWQWLIWNWEYGTEYMVNWRFYDKKSLKKLWFKHYDLKRRIYKTNSWETILNYIRSSYDKKMSDNIRKNIKWFPKNKITKPSHQNPLNISWKEQVKILTLSFWAKKNKWITKYTATLLQWNMWAIIKIYKLFHNTAPDKKTMKRIIEAEKKYYHRLMKYALNK